MSLLYESNLDFACKSRAERVSVRTVNLKEGANRWPAHTVFRLFVPTGQLESTAERSWWSSWCVCSVSLKEC